MNVSASTAINALPIRSWPACLEARFDGLSERTVLRRLSHQGPLRMQRLFWPEGQGRAHGYLLHPPGGLAPGDSLEVAVMLESCARTLITTPSANRIYRTDAQGNPQIQHNYLHVDKGCELEWLPQETIVFSGARSQQNLTLEAHSESRFFLWDNQVLGRIGSNAPFEAGESRQQITVRVDGHLTLRERLCVAANSPLLTQPWGLNGDHCFGTWIAGTQPEATAAELLDRLRENFAEYPPAAGIRFAFTRCDGLLVGRAQANDSEQLMRFMTDCWMWMRPHLLNCPPCRPRVWDT